MDMKEIIEIEEKLLTDQYFFNFMRDVFRFKVLMSKEDMIKHLSENSEIDPIEFDPTYLINFLFRDNFSIDDLEEFIKTMKEKMKISLNYAKRGEELPISIQIYILFFFKLWGQPKEAHIPTDNFSLNNVENIKFHRMYINLINFIYDNDLDLSEVKKYANLWEQTELNDTTISMDKVSVDNRTSKDKHAESYKLNDTTLMYPNNGGEIIDTQNHFTKYAVYELSIGEKVYYGYSQYRDNNQLENRVKMWLNDDKEGHVYNADVLVAFKRYGVFDLDIKYIVDTIDEAQSIKSNFIKYTDKTKLYNKR